MNGKSVQKTLKALEEAKVCFEKLIKTQMRKDALPVQRDLKRAADRAATFASLAIANNEEGIGAANQAADEAEELATQGQKFLDQKPE